MMARAPQTERSYDVIDILLFVWRAVMIILAAIAAVYGFWTAVAAETAKCAGMQWIAGYRGGVMALWGVPLVGIAAVAWTLFLFRKAKIREIPAVPRYRKALFSLGAIRITVGMMLVYGCIFGSPILFGIQMEFFMRRYHAIASYCRADVVSGGLGIARHGGRADGDICWLAERMHGIRISSELRAWRP